MEPCRLVETRTERGWRGWRCLVMAGREGEPRGLLWGNVVSALGTPGARAANSLGSSSSPMTVRNPPSERVSGSGSVGCTLASTPTSTWTLPPSLPICSFHASAPGGPLWKAVITKACEIASKSTST
jgi:hypothetical protein